MAFGSGHLEVDGLSLYYEARGTNGPLLLIVSAGMGTAHAHEGTAAMLSECFRVVTYDRRGFARSRNQDRPNSGFEDGNFSGSKVIERNAQDAAALIQHFSPNEPAYLYASCFGGAVVLELIQRYPNLVEKALLHEPSVPPLVNLPNREKVIGTLESLPHLYKTVSSKAASAAVMADIVNDQDKEALRKSDSYDNIVAHTAQHMAYFHTHESKHIAAYMVDWDLLIPHKNKVVLAVGTTSSLPTQLDPVRQIAARLKTTIIALPGSHFPFATDKSEAVERLAFLLNGSTITFRSKARL